MGASYQQFRVILSYMGSWRPTCTTKFLSQKNFFKSSLRNDSFIVSKLYCNRHTTSRLLTYRQWFFLLESRRYHTVCLLILTIPTPLFFLCFSPGGSSFSLGCRAWKAQTQNLICTVASLLALLVFIPQSSCAFLSELHPTHPNRPVLFHSHTTCHAVHLHLHMFLNTHVFLVPTV